ncbi:zinc finger MYM-type protein 1-like [Acyrthosiphon pisum]|uniref:DUF4371 domain-containing protein n=1 Tax=Acyrthosiphon pisum TaxID=7029 RepID=A0A8R2JL25_ACYPI|nr:zinc finger MYM-type protein 1-like [Acyrthosiphon pisum]
MSDNNKKYVKGGAQKTREKNKKLLTDSAKKCKKISNIFYKTSSPVNSECDSSTASVLCDSRSTATLQKKHTVQDSTRVINIDLDSSLTTNQKTTATESVLEIESLQYNLSSNEELLFKLKKNADIIEKINFVKQHPIQPSYFSNIRLDLEKLYFRKTPDDKKIARKWLSVFCIGNELKAMYCPFCIAFSSSATIFSKGCNNFKHIYDVVKIHEDSLTHRRSVEAFIQSTNEKSIEFGINNNLMTLKKNQILENIHVINEIFEIIKLLGRQNLPLRGSKNSESLYKWNDEDNLNKGNFLELVQFTAKRDATLYKHLNTAIENSKRRKANLEKKSLVSCGRGSLVTLLSKNTVNKVILSIVKSIRDKIKLELGEQHFSLQIDSTQDVSVVDQAAVCIRYIYEGEVKERLFALLKVVDSSGNGYYNMLKQLFSEHSIKFNNIIGESFDGAANMRGEYSGLQSKIKNQENPKAIYIWCYSHVLNLCICDTCKSLEAKNLFGFLNRLSTFFSESYKRMLVWLQEINSSLGSNKLKKLQKIGENNTRWWSREKALYWIFDGDQCLFPIIICALYHISISSNFEPKTKGMDLLSAWGMIDSIKQENGRLKPPFMIQTIAFTEVNCERTFSKLKLVKTRLRANMCQENLEALLIMSVEKQLLNDIEITKVIDYLKASSSVMSKMFSL